MCGEPAIAIILLTNAGALPAQRPEAVVSMVQRALRKSEVFSLAGRRGTTVRVTRGQVWLTQDGDARDHVLGAGDAMELKTSGSVVVFGLKEGSLQFLTPARAPGLWAGLVARFTWIGEQA